MLTWLIPVTRTAAVFPLSSHRSSAAGAIAPIAFVYEPPPARVLRRGRGRALVYAGGAACRDLAAVAVPAHPGARGRARRAGLQPAAARRLVDAGGTNAAARGADRCPRGRARAAQ